MLGALIVEDAALMRHYLMENLNNIHNCFRTIACARDGIEAIELLLSGIAPDIIITDIKMPRMNGLELASYVYDSKLNIPIIILSGYDEFQYAKQAMSYGVQNYLLKPLNDEELHNVLQNIALGSEKISTTNPVFDYEIKKKTDEVTCSLVARAISYIQRHFQTQLSIAEIAEALDVTPSYLSNIFHTQTGETYSKYILRLRMEKASLLLKTHRASKICDIATEVGYISPKHFCSTFKNYYQLTPSEYRNKHQNKINHAEAHMFEKGEKEPPAE